MFYKSNPGFLLSYNHAMQTIISTDKTPIAYKIMGSGPLLIIITGALNTHDFGVPGELAPWLQDDFTVLTYDRRGRGQSGSTPPYTIFKELEDIKSMIDHHGGKAFLFGHSAGAALALFAAAEFPDRITAVAAYEPPLTGNCFEQLVTKVLINRIKKQVSRGENLAVVTQFMRFVGMDEDLIAETLEGEHGQTIVNMAGTIVYEAKIQNASRDFLKSRAQDLTQPVLMLAGDKSFKTAPGIMRDFTHAIPFGQSRLLAGQTHTFEPMVIAPILKEFFSTLQVN
jgi:pimeloyl-ACP methyl ester carboxylesterase